MPPFAENVGEYFVAGFGIIVFSRKGRMVLYHGLRRNKTGTFGWHGHAFA
jgi:hypothetical protein